MLLKTTKPSFEGFVVYYLSKTYSDLKLHFDNAIDVIISGQLSKLDISASTG